jgi:hypothetical protein
MTTTTSLIRVDEDKLLELRDKLAHAEVFAQAAAQAVVEACTQLDELYVKAGKGGEER